jgi:hypothetical protein
MKYQITTNDLTVDTLLDLLWHIQDSWDNADQ